MFDKTTAAVKKAFAFTEEATGTKVDQSLKIYEKLKTPDFEHLTTVYGADQVTRYIQEMEKRRLLGGK